MARIRIETYEDPKGGTAARTIYIADDATETDISPVVETVDVHLEPGQLPRATMGLLIPTAEFVMTVSDQEVTFRSSVQDSKALLQAAQQEITKQQQQPEEPVKTP